MAERDHLRVVRDTLGSATDAPPVEGGGGGGGGGDGDGQGDDANAAFPSDCPVKPVGMENGVFHFISALGELRSLKADQVANKHIVALFAPKSGYLFDQWPRKKKVKNEHPHTGEVTEEWITTGWRTDDVSMVLMDEAARQGVWNAREKVRGRGGWRADDNTLILHAGNRVLYQGRWQRPGVYGDMVYPTQPESPRPSTQEGQTAEWLAPKLFDYLVDQGVSHERLTTAASMLLELFKRWQFARPEVDPMLLLGWNAAAIYGAAMDYRPLAWLTGDAATGKSALQKAIGYLHGSGILQSPDATEAAVRQILGQQSLPVAIDEAEAEKDNSKMQALVKLARLAASSQGNIARGGSDHQGHEFRATSCFLFSSILIPPIPPQDKSRLAVLEMDPIPAGAREPPLEEKEIAALGLQLRKDMADRWPVWRERLADFRNAMIDIGQHKGRTADQFGGLLAAADLALSAHPPSKDALTRWGQDLEADKLIEASDNTSEAERCIQWLVTTPVALSRGGERRSVGEWLADAVQIVDDASNPVIDAAAIREAAKKSLARIGIGLPKTKKGVPGVVYVAVASDHRGLMEVFQNSRWQDGVWAQALRRASGALKYQNARIGRKQMACTLVPITELLTDDNDCERELQDELAD